MSHTHISHIVGEDWRKNQNGRRRSGFDENENNCTHASTLQMQIVSIFIQQ